MAAIFFGFDVLILVFDTYIVLRQHNSIDKREIFFKL